MKHALAKFDAPAPRSSAVIEAEIKSLSDQKAEAVALIAKLAGDYDADVLRGDEAASANETATVAAKRTIRRCELSAPGLADELREAQASEAAAQRESERKVAEAAVAAVVADVDEMYLKPAAIIGAFMERYQRASDLARAADITIPHYLVGRYESGVELSPERVETSKIYLDETGAETSNPYPPGVYLLNSEGQPKHPHRRGQVFPERPTRLKQRVVPAKYSDSRSLDHLPDIVRLPALRLDDKEFWVGRDTVIIQDSGRRRR